LIIEQVYIYAFHLNKR